MSDVVPASVWRQEHHAKIFRAAGPCSRCLMRERETVTSCCNAPMCRVCALEHKREQCEERMQDDFEPDPEDTETPIL